MVHRFSHQQKFAQKMGLTPQMRLSIKLLGMGAKNLNEYIESALEANPFLKKEYEKGAKNHEGGSSLYGNSTASFEYNDGVSEQAGDPRSSLLSQLRMQNPDNKILEIAEYLISEMDDSGYIKLDSEQVAGDILVDVEDVERCMAEIQGLEPAGIGARDVRECLQLQLKRAGKEDSLEYAIVSDFMTEVARSDIAKIAGALGVDEEKVEAAINNIKKLNPRPASTMLSKSSEWVVPDLLAKVKDKKIRLEINREHLPTLKFYNPYEGEEEIASDAEAKEFLKENLDSAKNLIDNLRRREETMCKVADYILNHHRNEVINDIDELKSLTVKEIAEALGLHPTTINRTLSNKYIQLNDKVMPLRSLLSNGFKKENGEIASTVAIKKKLEALVKSEDKSRPLSDKAIQEKLAGEGIVINRRTIAKYRQTLRILPTHLRKKIMGSGLHI